MIDLIDMKAFEYEGEERGNADRDRDPRRPAGPGRGVPREADGRGRRELRRADGALPRGRGDLARGDRHRAQEGRHRGSPVPGHLRRGDQEPGHQPPAGGAGRGRSLAGDAGRRSRRSTPRATRSRSSPTEDGDPVAYVFKTTADPYTGRINLLRVYSGVLQLRLAGVQRHPQGEGADRPARRAARQGDLDRRRARRRATSARSPSSARRAPATSWPPRTPAISFPPLDLPAPVMAFAFEPKSKGDEEKAATRAPPPRARRTRRSTSTATRRPASRSSPGSPRSTSR